MGVERAKRNMRRAVELTDEEVDRILAVADIRDPEHREALRHQATVLRHPGARVIVLQMGQRHGLVDREGA